MKDGVVVSTESDQDKWDRCLRTGECFFCGGELVTAAEINTDVQTSQGPVPIDPRLHFDPAEQRRRDGRCKLKGGGVECVRRPEFEHQAPAVNLWAGEARFKRRRRAS